MFLLGTHVKTPNLELRIQLTSHWQNSNERIVSGATLGQQTFFLLENIDICRTNLQQHFWMTEKLANGIYVEIWYCWKWGIINLGSCGPNTQFLRLVSGKGKVVIPPLFYSKSLDRPTFGKNCILKNMVFFGGHDLGRSNTSGDRVKGLRFISHKNKSFRKV